MEYVYLGDRNTSEALKGRKCAAVRRKDGKCIRGRNGSMLVLFEDRRMQVVTGRLLRKIPLPPADTLKRNHNDWHSCE